MGGQCAFCYRNTSSDSGLILTKVDTQKEGELKTPSEFGVIKANCQKLSLLPNEKPHNMKYENIANKHSKKSMPRHSAFLNRTLLSLCVLGDAKSGKTSFINQFCKNIFTDEYSHSMQEEIENKKCPFNCRFYDIRIVIPLNYENLNRIEQSDFYLLFFDLSTVSSFEFAKQLFEEKLKNLYEKHDNNLSNVVLVGNKNDLQRQVDSKQIDDFSNSYTMGHFEISLKNNKGINNMIQKLIESFDNDVFKYQSDSKQI